MNDADPAAIAVAAILTCAAAFAYFYGGVFFGRGERRRVAGVLVLVLSLAAAWWLMQR